MADHAAKALALGAATGTIVSVGFVQARVGGHR